MSPTMSIAGRASRSVIAFLAALLLTAAAAPATDAAPPFVTAGSFAADAFNHPQRVAVEQSTGRIFVADRGSSGVAVYAPTAAGGDALTRFGDGELNGPVGIAIDQSDGSVYVADSANNRIARYLTDGGASPTYTADATYISPSTTDVGSFAAAIALDPTNDDLLIADPSSNTVKRFDTAGTLLGSFDGGPSTGGAFTGLLDLATDSTGDVIVVDATGDIAYGFAGSRVVRFDSDGTNPIAVGALDAPSTVTVIPGSDQVAVASNQSSYWFSTPLTITVFAPDGLTVSTTPLPDATTRGLVTGLAAGSDPFHRLYVATSRDTQIGTSGATGIQRLVADLRPTVTVDAASDIAARTATVSGSIDPVGIASTWQIEYRQTGDDEWRRAPATPVNVGSGTSAAPISVPLSALRPNTDYRWRIIAKNELLSTVVDGPGFHTGLSAPHAETAPASEVKSTSVRLNGIVDPYGQTTSYYIEWGYDTNYGTAIPATRDGNAGSEATATRYSKVVTNLIPGRPIHYRIIASNASGRTTGEDRTVLPPSIDRAYEQVSPVDKNGNAPNSIQTAQAASDGSALMFQSTGGFAGAQGVNPYNGYISRRSTDAWTTEAAALPQTSVSFISATTSIDASSDLRYTFGLSTRALAPGAVEGMDNLYVRDQGSGAVQYIGSGPAGTLSNTQGSVFLAGNQDFSHVVFQAALTNTPGVPEAERSDLWEFVDGRLRAVAKGLDGTVFPTVAYPSPTKHAPLNNLISSDQRRIYYFANSLYLREDGERTILVAGSQRTGDDPNIPRNVDGIAGPGASANGDIVYFVSKDVLTDQSPHPEDSASRSRLYRWERATRELTEIVTGDDSLHTQIIIRRVSDDGKRVYYTQETANATLLATWSAQSGPVEIAAGFDGIVETVSAAASDSGISPDGTKFAFGARARLTAGDNRNSRCKGSTGGAYLMGLCTAVYLYDASTDTLRCVSCDPAGGRTAADARLGGVTANPFSTSQHDPRSVDNTARVYFDSPDRLVPEDTDGKLDVYRSGHDGVELLTPGTLTDSTFADRSVDGRDVFFTSTDRLVGADRDDIADIYDARLGGGLAGQGAREGSVPCSGDDCQGALPPQPTRGVPGSSTFTGASNVVVPERAKVKANVKVLVAKVTRGTSGRIRVTVPGAGRVRVTGAGVIARSAVSPKAGTYALAIRLTAKSRRTLAHDRSLTVRLTVQFQPKSGSAQSKAVRMAFAPTAAKKGHGHE